MSRSRRQLADQLRNTLQIEPAGSMADVFAEEPPPLSVFVQDRKYLSNPPLSPAQFDFVRHFEQVLFIPTYIDMVEAFGEEWSPVRMVNQLSAQWGKGGGKDHVCQIAFARVSNILLCLRSPHEYFDLPHQSILHMMNVAISAPQAHGVFFKPLRSLVTTSPWFRDKFEGDEPGPQAKEIRFIKKIELVSGHSSAEGLEGKNLLASIADEIAAFPSQEELQQSKTGRQPAKSADGILDMLKSSSLRFPETYKLAQISYPRYKGDAIQQATAKGRRNIEAKGEKSTHYVSGPLKTWDVNPRYDRFDRILLPGVGYEIPNVPDLVDDYETNPRYGRAKYECEPELAENRYFKDSTAIRSSFSKPADPEPLEIHYEMGLEVLDGEQTPEPQWTARFEINVAPVPGALYAIHGDMAIKGDRAGVALCHVASWDSSDDGDPDVSPEERPLVKVDFVAAFEADETAVSEDGRVVPREIQLRWYRKLIVELVDLGFSIEMATFDRFQSSDTMQILNARGIESKHQSTDTDMKPWETLRDLMYEGRIEGHANEILCGELEALNRLRNGRVDHPPGGSKDMADALAGAAYHSTLLGGQEEDDQYVDWERPAPAKQSRHGSLMPMLIPQSGPEPIQDVW